MVRNNCLPLKREVYEAGRSNIINRLLNNVFAPIACFPQYIIIAQSISQEEKN